MHDRHIERASEAPDQLVAPGLFIAARYRLVRRIGAGGMGEVWRARDVQRDEAVAVKILARGLIDSQEAMGRFEREARLLQRIESPHVCRVIDVGALDDRRPFMVMELLVGHDLATLLERCPQLELEAAVDLGLQLCEALGEAHVRHIVHRDIKPENVFLSDGDDGRRRLRLLDFGLSKERGLGEPRERRLTHTKQVMGTPTYMAPEQWISSARVGPAADQWAVGTIVFEMLVGQPVFDGDNVAQICGRVLNEATPSVVDRRPDLPRGLDGVLHKCLEKDPRRRYDNVGALALALSAYGPRGAASRAERLASMLGAVAVGSEPNLIVPSRHHSSEMEVTAVRVRGERTGASHSWQTSARPTQRRVRLAGWMALSAGLVTLAAFATDRGPEPLAPAAAMERPDLPEWPGAGVTAKDGPAIPSAVSLPVEAPTATPPTTTKRPKASRRATQPKPARQPPPQSIFDDRW